MDSKQPKGSIFLNTLCAIFFFLWGGFLINNPVMADDKTVCPSGCDYTSIQMAINAAFGEGGGTVYVGTTGRSTAETYYENFGMMNGVNVVSEGNDTTVSYTGSNHTTTALKRATLTIIDGGGSDSDSVVRIPDVNGTLDGFTIQNASLVDMFLVRVGGGSPTLKNNIICDNTGTGSAGGIGLQGILGAELSPTIENNLIHNVNGPGIGNGPGSHAMILNNEIWDCKDDEGSGIGLLGNTYPTIENNIIFNNSKAGIGSDYSHGGNSGLAAGGSGNTLTIPTIKGNTIYNNHGGIRLERAGGDSGTINVTIGTNNASDGNNIYLNHGGIWLDGLNAVTISQNNIYHSIKAGIRLENTENITISDNNIHANSEAGIYFEENVEQATVENNQIYSNSQAGIRNGDMGSQDNGLATLIVLNNNIYSNGLGSNSSAKQYGGISIDYAASTNTIQDNTIRNNTKGGIFIERADSVTVDNNEIYENGQGGIRNQGANTLIVQNSNDIYSNGSNSSSNDGGISIEYAASTNTIQDNNIHDNLFGGIQVAEAASVTVQDNFIHDNGYGGINNKGINDLTVSGNHIYGNGYGGININSGTGNITQNTIEQNSRGGIGIMAPCTFEITNNEIHNNLRGGIHTGDDSANGGGYTDSGDYGYLTIKSNKVYRNGQNGYGGGIDVRHAYGVINNNLVYENHRAGIRFGDWIEEIVNNTVVGNGQDDIGAGIVYDDLAGEVNADPGGCAPDIPIKNNICTNNEKSGIYVKNCPNYTCPGQRDYNLLCRNHGISSDTCSPQMYFCILRQLRMCGKNSHEIFDNPLFVNAANDNYHLQSGSPAENAGDDGSDMGAYGGADPIAW